MEEQNLKNRVTSLEELAAHQARTIDELSAELAAQWKTVDLLQLKIERLSEQFRALEDATLEAHPITKPPHY